MNDELKRLKQQLEQATAQTPIKEPLDEETESLREAWLEFGNLLEAAQPSTEMPKPTPLRWPAPRRRWLAPVAAIATTLCLGIVMALGWYLPGIMSPIRTAPSPGELAITTTEQPEVIEPDAVSLSPSEADELAWEGTTLDEQLASLGQSVLDVEEAWAYSVTPIETFYNGMDQLDSDLSNNDNTL